MNKYSQKKNSKPTWTGNGGGAILLGEALHMPNTYTAVTKQHDGWWIGWIEEVPGVNCQERTHKELLRSLKATLKEALEFNRQDALQAAVTGYIEEPVTL
jgi:predicted RNase H-like HicB family nuclease